MVSWNCKITSMNLACLTRHRPFTISSDNNPVKYSFLSLTYSSRKVKGESKRPVIDVVKAQTTQGCFFQSILIIPSSFLSGIQSKQIVQTQISQWTPIPLSLWPLLEWVRIRPFTNMARKTPMLTGQAFPTQSKRITLPSPSSWSFHWTIMNVRNTHFALELSWVTWQICCEYLLTWSGNIFYW